MFNILMHNSPLHDSPPSIFMPLLNSPPSATPDSDTRSEPIHETVSTRGSCRRALSSRSRCAASCAWSSATTCACAPARFCSCSSASPRARSSCRRLLGHSAVDGLPPGTRWHITRACRHASNRHASSWRSQGRIADQLLPSLLIQRRDQPRILNPHPELLPA